MTKKASRYEESDATLLSLLLVIMLTTAYQHGALSVLSKFVIEDLQITRGQLGLTFSAFPLMAAASSPWVGKTTDRKRPAVLNGLFLIAASGLLLVAATPNLAGLLVAACLGGISLAAANPVTNSIISQQIPAIRRGRVLGIKQAGPPFGILVAGLALPPLAGLLGWRAAIAAGLLLPAVGFVTAQTSKARSLITTPIPATASRSQHGSGAIGSTVKWLTVLGSGVALGNGALIGFLPLYAQESIGMTPTSAGLVASLLGLVGVVGRVVWGAQTKQFSRPSTALIAMSWMSVLAIGAIAAAEWMGPLLLWIGAAAAGGSLFAWHVVAWLIAFDNSSPESIGRTSGFVQGGIALGFAAGAPIAGALIDRTGSYQPVWGLTATVFVLVSLTTWGIRHRSGKGASG